MYPPAPPPPPAALYPDPKKKSPPAPPPPTTKYSSTKFLNELILNVLGTTGLIPSEAFTVNEYVVLVVTLGNVPEINPVDEFRVTPEGKVDPLARAYEIVESESVAVADKDTETNSSNVPRDPDAVCQTGVAFT